MCITLLFEAMETFCCLGTCHHVHAPAIDRLAVYLDRDHDHDRDYLPDYLFRRTVCCQECPSPHVQMQMQASLCRALRRH